MSDIELTEADIEQGAYIETVIESFFDDDDHKAGVVKEIVEETKHVGVSSTIEQTLVVLTNGDEEYRINIDNLTGDGGSVKVVEFRAADADNDDEEDDGTDDSESDDQELVADGGRETDADLNEHVDDGTIEDAIAQHDDPDHPDSLTVADVREMLAVVSESHREGWDVTMDNLEDDDTRLVAETDDLLVLDTGDVDTNIEDYELVTGDELDTIERRVLSQVIHALTCEHALEHNWGVAYPLVMVKHDGIGDGQRYVEAVINSLCERGLSPGQAWAYYGVEIRGHSRNQWARRMGYDDHSTVSQAVRKAKEKLGA